MQHCHHCGRDNQDAAKFCGGCGQTLSETLGDGMLKRGTVLKGSYRIEELLGRGGFGTVYRATHVRLETLFAIKENGGSHATLPDDQFLTEARLLASLNHAHLPRVTDSFIEPDGRQYLVMQFIEGPNLHDRVKTRGALRESEALEVMEDILSAVSHLHSRRPPIIHRDIKPANIIIAPTGMAVLVDVGIAKVGGADVATRSEAAGYTSGYSSPEQEAGGRTSERSDIYSLGATLYHVLTGERPPSALALMNGSAVLKPLRQQNPAISPSVAAAIEKAMALPEAQRFATVEEFKRALTISSPQPQPAPPQPPSPSEGQEPTVVGGNDSGTGRKAVLPSELEGYNWGAFLMTWVWAIAHKAWIGLFALCLPIGLALWPFRAHGPAQDPLQRALGILFLCIGVMTPFALLLMGNQWAWQKCRWKNQRHFRKVQDKWAFFGIAGMPLINSVLLFGVVIPLDTALKRSSAASSQPQASVSPTPPSNVPPSPTPTPGPVEVAESSNDQGDSLLDQKKHAAAEQAYRKAVHLAPKNADYWNDLGLAREGLGDDLAAKKKFKDAVKEYEEAEDAFLQATRQPTKPDQRAVYQENLGAARGKQGQILLDLKQWKSAATAYQKAIQTDKSNATYHNNLGVALERQGQYKEAETAYRKAIEKDDSNALYHNNLGFALERQGQYKEAETAHRKAIQTDESNATYHNDLGVALGRQGQNAAAEQAYRKAIEKDDSNALYWNNLGLARNEAGIELARKNKLSEAGQKFKAAADAHRRAIAINPKQDKYREGLRGALHNQRLTSRR